MEKQVTKENKKRNKEKIIESFIKKWSGVMKNHDIELRKLDYLVEKHRRY